MPWSEAKMLSQMLFKNWVYLTYWLDPPNSLVWNSSVFNFNLLGSKELGTNVLELHFVMLANHDQNVLVLFRLAQSMYLYVKLESSVLQDLLCKSAWFDRSRIRLNRSKLVQIIFLQNFPTQPKPIWRVGLNVLLLIYKGNPKHIFIRLLREKIVCLFLYLGFCIQKLSKVFVAPYAVCVNFL